MQESILQGAEAAVAMTVPAVTTTAELTAPQSLIGAETATGSISSAALGTTGTALTALQKKDLLNRLARIEGQLRGVQKLIVTAEVPADCAGIAQQMAAARKAMDRAFTTLLTSALITQTGTAKTTTEAAERAVHLAGLLDKFA
jgi:DNA-binding FrmR family transcriptional regulator